MPLPPHVTVLMPVLNPHPVYFAEAVESILSQSFDDWELLIVEAPGERSAKPMLSRFRDPRIRHTELTDRPGLVAQLNLGLHAAAGDFIARMDADDVASPDRLRLQREYLVAHPDVAVVGGQISIIDEAGWLIGGRAYPEQPLDVAARLKYHNPLAHPATMFRRHAVLSVNGYRERSRRGTEDYDLWCRLHLAGFHLANIKENVLRYRVHPDASKARQLKEQLQATIDLKREHFGGQLGCIPSLRLAAEKALLYMPPSFVLWLFARTQLRRAKAK